MASYGMQGWSPGGEIIIDTSIGISKIQSIHKYQQVSLQTVYIPLPGYDTTIDHLYIYSPNYTWYCTDDTNDPKYTEEPTPKYYTKIEEYTTHTGDYLTITDGPGYVSISSNQFPTSTAIPTPIPNTTFPNLYQGYIIPGFPANITVIVARK